MYGYNNFNEFLSSWLKAITTNFYIKFLLPFFLFVDAFFAWVFVSTGGIYFLILLYVIDFITGIGKAVYFSIKIRKHKNQGLEVPEYFEDNKLISKKFPRFLLTMLSSVMLLGLLKFAGIHSILFIPLFSIFYAAFVGQQLISITENLSQVGIFSRELYTKLNSKITDITNKL